MAKPFLESSFTRVNMAIWKLLNTHSDVKWKTGVYRKYEHRADLMVMFIAGVIMPLTTRASQILLHQDRYANRPNDIACLAGLQQPIPLATSGGSPRRRRWPDW
jgi:hypothetical protein